MNSEMLESAELEAVRQQIDWLAQRRAGGEITPLYPFVSDISDVLFSLAQDAPELESEVLELVDRCNMLLRSLAH